MKTAAKLLLLAALLCPGTGSAGDVGGATPLPGSPSLEDRVELARGDRRGSVVAAVDPALLAGPAPAGVAGPTILAQLGIPRVITWASTTGNSGLSWGSTSQIVSTQPYVTYDGTDVRINSPDTKGILFEFNGTDSLRFVDDGTDAEIQIPAASTLDFTDGTNTLMQLADSGITGNLIFPNAGGGITNNAGNGTSSVILNTTVLDLTGPNGGSTRFRDPSLNTLGAVTDLGTQGAMMIDFYRPLATGGNLTFEDSAGNDFGYFMDNGTTGTLVLASSLVITGSCTGCGGGGDVVGPASALADGLVTFNGTTGKLVQSESLITAALNTMEYTGTGSGFLFKSDLATTTGDAFTFRPTSDMAGSGNVVVFEDNNGNTTLGKISGTGTFWIGSFAIQSGTSLLSYDNNSNEMGGFTDLGTTFNFTIEGGGFYVNDTNVGISETGTNGLSLTFGSRVLFNGAGAWPFDFATTTIDIIDPQGNSGIQIIDAGTTLNMTVDGTFGVGSNTLYGDGSVHAGTILASTVGSGNTQYALGGSLNVDSTAVGNVGVGEDTLQTYDLPASTLTGTNRGIHFKAWGTGANTANAKTLKCYFGSTVILTNAFTTSLAESWEVEAWIIRTGASTQDYRTTFFGNTGAANALVYDPELGTSAQTESAAITIKCTGDATSNNDIVEEGSLVEIF